MLIAAALLVAGVLSAGFAGRLRVPGPLLFLALGMLIADDGLALVRLADPAVAQIAGTVALVIILFEGGLTTKPRDLRIAAVPGILLATVGVVATAAVVAGGALLVLDVEPLTAVLLGSVVASTDAAAVFNVLRRARLPRRLTALLEVESGSNDPMAILLTVGVLQAMEVTAGPVDWLAFGAVQLGGGILAGLVVGAAGGLLLSRADLGAIGLYPVLALGVAGLSYGLAAAAGASGFLAVYVTGLLIGARVPRHRRNIRTFHDGLANTATIALFLLLGILVFPTQLPAVALPALALTAVLIVVARPVAVALCMAWFRPRWRDLVFVSWAGLRGAVPIVLATFPFTAQHPQASLVFNVVFFVVLVSTAVQGSTVSVVASRLGLSEEGQRWAPVAEIVPLDEAEGEMVEVDLTEDLYVTGRLLREVPLPEGALATTLMRGQRVLVPTGSTRLQAGDLVFVAMPRRPDAAERLVAWARGEDRHDGDAAGPRPSPEP